MIPPANNMIQDESGGKQDEQEQDETPKSPSANASQQETKVGLRPGVTYYSPSPRIDRHDVRLQSLLLFIEHGKQTSTSMAVKSIQQMSPSKKVLKLPFPLFKSQIATLISIDPYLINSFSLIEINKDTVAVQQ